MSKRRKFLIGLGWLVLGMLLLLAPEALANSQQPPRPSLEILPDDAEGCEPEGYFDIVNTSQDAKDIARGVLVEILVVKEGEYVDHIEYNPIVGTILPGHSRRVDFEIVVNDDWVLAPIGTEIKIKIVVVRENNWPSHNVDRHEYYTYKQCRQWVKYSIDATRLDWQVLKSGVYTTKAFAITLFSNGEVTLEFIASNVVGSSGSIETWYAVGNDLPEEESSSWGKSFTLSFDPAPSGITVQFWNKINVTSEISACEYEDGPTITISSRT